MLDKTLTDHQRGCEGRNYTCTCGYDDQVERAAQYALERIKALEADEAEQRRLKEGYYNEAADGWAKAKRLKAENERLRALARRCAQIWRDAIERDEDDGMRCLDGPEDQDAFIALERALAPPKENGK